MEEILESLVRIAPRELSGSETSASYDFQKDWAICLLIQEEKKEKDYLVFFDYHEDIVLLDSAIKPQSAQFYQIKKKRTGSWTTRALTALSENKRDGTKSSILGKLVNNAVVFGEKASRLSFVSNTYFNCKISGGEKSLERNMICVEELADEDRKLVIDALNQEFVALDSGILKSIFLEKSSLPFDSSDKFTRGVLSDYLDGLSPNGKYNIGLIYRTLFDEVRRKTNFAYKITRLEDIGNKSISSSDFRAMITKFLEKEPNAERFESIRPILIQEGLNFLEVKKLAEGYRSVIVRLMDRDNPAGLELVNRVQEYLVSQPLKQTLVENADVFYSSVAASWAKCFLFTENEIRSYFMVTASA